MAKRNTNVEQTASALSRMLTRGMLIAKGSERVRPATMDDVQNYLQARGFVGSDGKGSPTVFADSLGIKYGMDQAFANGVLLNWGAEIGSLKDLLLKGGDITAHYRDRVLGQQMLATESPAGSFAAEAAGTLVPGLGMGLPAELAMTQRVQRAHPMALRSAQRMMSPLQASATVGAGEGAIYAAGSDVTGFERMTAMLMSAGVGGAAGAAAYGLTTLFGQLKQAVSRQLGVQSKTGEAADIGMEALRADTSELTGTKYSGAEDAVQELALRREVAPGSQPIPADLGEEMRITGQAVIEGGSPETRSAGINLLQQRQRGVRDPGSLVRSGGQSERLTAALEEGTGITSEALDSTIDLLQESTRRESRSAYALAYRVSPLDVPAINSRMGLQEYQAAYRRGYSLSVKEARVDPEAPTLRPPPEGGNLQPPYSIAELDYTARGLRDQIAKQFSSPDGYGPQESRAATLDLKQFLDDIDELSGEFKAARQAYAIGTHAEEALENGYKMLKKRPRSIAHELSKMTEGERKYYRIGGAQAMFEFMESKGLGRNVAALIDDHPEQLKRIEVLFGNEKNFQSFMQRVVSEMEGARTSSSLGGSQTARLQAAQARIGIQPGGENFVAGAVQAPTSTLGQVADTVMLQPLKRGGGKRVADQLGSVLMEPDPALQALKLRAWERMQRQRTFNRGATRGAGGLLGPSLALPAINE